MIKKTISNLDNIIFYIAYSLILFSWYFTRIVFVSQYIKYFKILGIILLLINCFIQAKNYSKKSLMRIVLLTLLGFISYYFSGSDIVLILLLMLFAIKNIQFTSLVKFDMYLKIFIVVLLFILYKFGYTNETLTLRDGVIRYSYGFSHPNLFGFVVSNIVMDFIFLNKNRMNLFYILFVCIVIFLIDHYSDSRSSAILLFMILLICLCKEEKLKKFFENRIIKFIVSNAWFIFTIISLILGYLYFKNTDIGIQLNLLFTSRLRHISEFLTKYDVNLFGNKLILISTEDALVLKTAPAILDNTYIHYLLRFGIIISLIIAIYLKRVFKYAYSKKNYVLIGILFIFLIYSMMENRLNQIVFILYMSKAIYFESCKCKNDKINL